MNWDDLRTFLTLSRCGKLTEAGRRLKVDHSTVSRRVKMLEKSMATKLFERQPNGYVLTPAGVDLVEYAVQMEAIAISAESKVVHKSEQLSGPVRVAAPEGIAAFAVASAAQELCENHPKLQIQLLTNAQRYSLSKREADFMISVSRPKTGRLKIQKVSDVKLHLYGSKSYLDNHPPIREMKDLKLLRGISYVPDLLPDKELDYRSFFGQNFEPSLTATGVHVQSAAILNGAGVGIMHDFMAKSHPNLVKILPKKISITRTLWGVVHQDYEHVERIQIVSKTIVEHIRNSLK